MIDRSLTNSPGTSGNDGLEEDFALRADKALIDNPGHIVDVDVAAAYKSRDLLIADAGDLAVHEGCYRTAPAPSATVLPRSRRIRMALAISDSSTVTISSTYF